ncbi:N-acetylmuramoyl-L-alanine amidase [Bacillus thermophilus]|uniref:N-acetylmuramoyl-L-alanine amidase n=2 Tax=Bacillaceae TaxID=186817 RepID=A0ABS2RCY7_9BACI|nr:N-acetylmuramoyl-L-alanine amidase [Siminovitchia thermophila]
MNIPSLVFYAFCHEEEQPVSPFNKPGACQYTIHGSQSEFGGDGMAVVKARESDIDLLARLLRAEAEGEGIQGMLHVGAVGVNRIRANCSDFVGIRTVPQMIYQPHAFEAVIHGYFYQRARESERRLARRAIRGERQWPAKYSLWYFRPEGDCPAQWYGQPLVARYKSHCFYEPTGEECPNIYSTF